MESEADKLQRWKEREAFRDSKFQIVLEEEKILGMDITNILVTLNGNGWHHLPLKKSEIRKLIKELQAHVGDEE